MLDVKELRKIGRNEAVEMLGGFDSVKKYEELCVDSYGMENDREFSYFLGFDTVETNYDHKIMINEESLEYYAMVKVNAMTGAVTRDYKNSRLPS